ncbi:MAG: ABC transporter substrate-binding protein [Rhodocyclaceae bacterium]|nr:ABC transporter substrate-binding protein [Rhodocyclaceae bacterium]
MSLLTLARAFGALGLSFTLGIGAASAAEIRIGQVAPYSGPLAPTGKHVGAGIQLYFDKVNASGGVNGNTLRLVTRDDAYKSDETIKQVGELIANEAPLALCGLVGTGNVTKLLNSGVIDKAGIPVVGARTGAAHLRRPAPALLFHARASYGSEVRAMVQQMHSMGINDVAVFYQDDAFGKDGLEGAKTALKEAGMKLVATGAYTKNSTDVSAAVNTIAKAMPMGVIMVSNTAASAAFVAAFRPANPATQLIALSVTDGPQVAERIGNKMARGLGVTQVVPDPVGGASPLAQEVRKAWAEHPQEGIDLNHTVLEGYLMAKVLVEGIRRAGPEPTRARLASALNAMQGFDVGGLRIGYTPEDHDGAHYTEITVLDRNGRPIK